MLLLIMLWLAVYVCAVAGWRAGAFSKPISHTLAGISCALLACGALVTKNLHWLPESLIRDETVYIQYAWFTLPAAFLFFLAARQSEIQGGKHSRLIIIFILFLAAFSSMRLIDQQGWLLGTIGTSDAKLDSNGVVLQNSSSTCGAASCATLLRHLNIDSNATEAQMIPLCQTGMFGSTPLGMAVGLKKVAAAKGWHVRILQCNWETLRRLRRPAVVSTRFGMIANHAVAVLSFKDGGVHVGDPLSGLSWWPANDFKDVFAGEAVVLFKTDPFTDE